jgi:hypothetical protein
LCSFIDDKINTSLGWVYHVITRALSSTSQT